jgi:hypothetical protein
VGAGVVVCAHHANAQGGDRALAEELFRQGQALMLEKKFADACPKLAESQRLDPTAGTLLNLGVCHEKEGRLASAWAEFNDAKALAQRDGREDRVAFANEHIAAIEPNLSRLKIELSPGAETPGLEISLDGNVLGRPTLGVAAPVDPGAHQVSAKAPGKLAWKADVDVPTGPATRDVLVPVLVNAALTPEETAAITPRPPAEGKSGATQRYVAYGLFGVGVAGIAVGTIFGLQAIAKNDDSNAQGCTGNDCTHDAAELRRDARTAGNISTVAFIAGGAALAGATVLYLTAPHDRGAPSTGARVRVLSAGASLEWGAAW